MNSNKSSDNSGIYQPTVMTNNPTPGPKYLVMSRTKSEQTLARVSPFLIKRVIDSVCGGEVDSCKKWRDGRILIKTKNFIQAAKLLKLEVLSPTIDVEVIEHNSLNFAKGVIYCNDLRGIGEEEIQHELKSQNVRKVEKIRRRKSADNLEETGLITLTFNSTSLPSEISIGYERVEIRTYVPRPIRCRNCFRYGHMENICTNIKLCSNCSNEFHKCEQFKEVCKTAKSCINCKEQNLDFNHATINSKCPIYIKEKEIQAIVTLEKVNKNKAVNLYKERHSNTL
ncbi:uncharacterized protein LOC135950753 [Calliphora vicina]|uniref:uncharacterized protein LOC135950753 n=1 Tax=Calliphora vicina TaxID=7373 RepID=UPI00325BF935